MTNKLYHLSPLPLRAESVIEPGNWGRIVRATGWRHPFAAEEVMLEEVRQNSFPHLPSRLECAFYFDDIAQAIHFANEQAQKDNGHLVGHSQILYQVELDNPTAPHHEADWRDVKPFFPYDMKNDPLNLDWCRRYWLGAPSPWKHELPTMRREHLTLSALRIVQRVPLLGGVT